MVCSRWLVATLLVAVTLLGLAHIAVLPPFEGMDETAHYSSIVQLADTGTVPVLGQARLAQEVARYQARGPMPYSSPSTGGQTYRTFFAGNPEALADAASPPFEPSSSDNWQGQHPPLYYIAMAPLARAMAGAPLKDRLLVLRTASLLLAVAALWVAATANRRLLPGTAAITAAWPLLMPGWFPEMARLGNDSLVALWISAAWAALAAILSGDRRPRWWALAGLALGLGCLTKTYMVAVGAGFLALLAWDAWRHGHGRLFALCLGLVVAIGAPWHVWLWSRSIALTNDGLLLAAQGGLLGGLAEHWAPGAFAYSLSSVAKSFLWSGTWSFGRPPSLFYWPLIAQWLLVLAGWRRVLRDRPEMAALPLLPVAPLAAGLAYHCLMWLAIDGRSGITGGWYLHTLAAPLALLVGLSLSQLGTWARRVSLGLMVYTLGFGAALAWLQASMFAGCTDRAVTADYRIDPSCLFDAALMFDRLSVLSYPLPALIGFSLAAALVVVSRFPFMESR